MGCVDSVQLVSDVMSQAHLALYSFANGQISASLKLMYRALYLALLCSGDSHPDIALYYVSSITFSPFICLNVLFIRALELWYCFYELSTFLQMFVFLYKIYSAFLEMFYV